MANSTDGGLRELRENSSCLLLQTFMYDRSTMTASTTVDRRQGSRRAIAILTVCALVSIHSPATADPMLPSAHLKRNHLARSASNKPFKKTHAERMAHRTRQWKEYHSGSYSGAPPADYGGQHPFEVMAAAGAKSDTAASAKRPQLRSRGLIQGGTYPD